MRDTRRAALLQTKGKKLEGSLSLDKASMTLYRANTTGTIAVDRSGDGAISAGSSDTNVCTASVSGTDVIVTCIGHGTATITVSVGEGAGYLAPSDAACSYKTHFYGDLNWDGVVDADDAEYFSRYLSGWSGYPVDDLKVADVNGDGAVNGLDFLYLTRHLEGWPGYEILGPQD